MQLWLLLVACVAFALAVPINTEIHFGRTIPIHIPTQSVDSNTTFEVPSWLGAIYATVNTSSTWILPLTIGNGGQTYPGEFLFIRNYGPATITLYANAPETIEGASSYSIPAGSIFQALSGYPDWTVVTDDSGQLQWIYTFEGINTAGGIEAPLYTVEIGPGVHNSPPPICNTGIAGNCSNWNSINIGINSGVNNTGFAVINIGQNAGTWNSVDSVVNLGRNAGTENAGSSANNIGSSAGRQNTGVDANNIGSSAGRYNTGTVVNNLGSGAGTNNTGSDVNNIGRSAGLLNTGTYVNNIGRFAGTNNGGVDTNNVGRSAGQYNTGANANNFGPLAGQYNTGSHVNIFGPSAGTNNTGSYCSHNGFQAGRLNTFDHCYTNGRDSACTAANQFVFGSTSYPLQLRLPTDSGSYCTGAAYDTCLNRAAANAWTFNAGTSLRVPQYLGVGATTAPANTAVGAISTTKATPALQAFGAVTANAASGVLAFTVNTAAGVCGAAVVTNSNVVAGSEVILTIQKYTGQYITNGTPMVTREDTAGSSVGNFNLNLCNINPTNALSGTLYVAFWVLN